MLPDEIEINNYKVNLIEDNAEKLNLYYEESICEIANSIHNVHENNAQLESQNYTRWNKFKLINLFELEKLINKQTNKGSFDNITTTFIKENYNNVDKFLLNIINSSLVNGEIINELKILWITPVPKVPHPKKANELRPINTLPFIEKLIENIV